MFVGVRHCNSPVVCENSNENTDDRLIDKSGTESNFQMLSMSSHDTNRRKVVRKYVPNI